MMRHLKFFATMPHLCGGRHRCYIADAGVVMVVGGGVSLVFRNCLCFWYVRHITSPSIRCRVVGIVVFFVFFSLFVFCTQKDSENEDDDEEDARGGDGVSPSKPSRDDSEASKVTRSQSSESN